MTRSAILAAVVTLAACGGSAGSGGNTMVGACVAPVNGCASADYVDLRGGSAVITFGNSGSLTYSPRCAEVSVNQTVTFQAGSGASFAVHPISETCGPVNAIPHTTSGTSLAVQFGTAGNYGYQCDVHFSSGMTGAIEVVP